jgi:hypothetical protein
MGNINCRGLVTNYVVTTDSYYKLHYLVSIALYGLLYFNYLKEQEFEDVENRAVVFISKFIIMPLILNYVVATVFFYLVQLMKRKLIARAQRKCGARRGDDMTDGELKSMVTSAARDLRSSSKKSSRRRRSKKRSSKKSSKKRSSKKRSSKKRSSKKSPKKSSPK